MQNCPVCVCVSCVCPVCMCVCRVCCYLEDGDECLREIVEVASSDLLIREVELSSEHLHAQQSEDDNEEEEEEQERCDGADRVQQRCHQVTERRPVPNTHTQWHVVEHFYSGSLRQ